MIFRSGVTEAKHLVSDPDGLIHNEDIGEAILYKKELKDSKHLQMKRCLHLINPKGDIPCIYITLHRLTILIYRCHIYL